MWRRVSFDTLRHRSVAKSVGSVAKSVKRHISFLGLFVLSPVRVTVETDLSRLAIPYRDVLIKVCDLSCVGFGVGLCVMCV